ncbi:YihA family ribosome biogenesis GTP-binding protein [Soehngenia saccharolytica]|nr:YihA family ribosome biogenesis GTP-binding protein [Soehngenia saccharolytica]
MKVNKSELEKIAVDREHYPNDELPEIAFVGRSNVGKSSLINALLNRKNLARTSSKPGKTRTINFYLVNDKIRFVDLPGYGYAEVSFSERNKWADIINEYLIHRVNLRAIIMIVDIRHEPTDNDLMMYEFLNAYGYTNIVVATKADKISKGKWQNNLKIIRNKLKLKDETLLIPVSSVDKANIEKLWEVIDGLI